MKLRNLTMLFALFFPTVCWATQSGNWTIEYMQNEGRKSGCLMQTGYVSGTKLGVAVYKDYAWGLALYNESWKLKLGGTTDVAAYVDGRLMATGKASSISSNFAILPLEKAAVYRALQIGHVLELKTPSGQLNFSLDGTAQAMELVLDCVRGLQPPTQESTETATEPKPISDASNAVSSADATIMLTNMLNAAGITGYRLVPPNASIEKGKGEGEVSFVLGDGSKGFFTAVKNSPPDGADEVAVGVVQGAATYCKGEFKSGKQPVSTSDGSVVRKTVAACKTESGTVIAETTIVRRSDAQLYYLMHIMNEGSRSLSDDSPESASGGPQLTDAAMRFGPGK